MFVLLQTEIKSLGFGTGPADLHFAGKKGTSVYWKLTYIGSLATCPACLDFIGAMILKQSKIEVEYFMVQKSQS